MTEDPEHVLSQEESCRRELNDANDYLRFLGLEEIFVGTNEMLSILKARTQICLTCMKQGLCSVRPDVQSLLIDPQAEIESPAAVREVAE
jgi:hypothetical protein